MKHEVKLGKNNNADNRSALWLDLSDYISGPSLNPQGDYLAIVKIQRTDEGKITKLNIYKTSENIKKAEDFT